MTFALNVWAGAGAGAGAGDAARLEPAAAAPRADPLTESSLNRVLVSEISVFKTG